VGADYQNYLKKRQRRRPLSNSKSPVSVVMKPPEALYEFRDKLFQLAGTSVKDDRPHSSRDFLRRLVQPWVTPAMTYSTLVAKYVGLWSVLEQPDGWKFCLQGLLGLRYLDQKNLAVAQRIFEEIEFHTSTPAALTYVMRGVSIFVRTVLLIVLFIGYATPAITSFVSILSGHHSDLSALASGISVPAWHILIAAGAGMMGSVVSLLLRISEFESTRGRSQTFLLLTGSTLPIIGGVFGAFLAVLLESQVIHLSIGNPGEPSIYLFIVIGFLSGFSERFSRGFISAAEQQIGGASQPPKQPIGGVREARKRWDQPVSLATEDTPNSQSPLASSQG
jgi:hypothetical protein